MGHLALTGAAMVGTWLLGAVAFVLIYIALVALLALLCWAFSEDGQTAILTLFVVCALAWGLIYGAWAIGRWVLEVAHVG